MKSTQSCERRIKSDVRKKVTQDHLIIRILDGCRDEGIREQKLIYTVENSSFIFPTEIPAREQRTIPRLWSSLRGTSEDNKKIMTIIPSRIFQNTWTVILLYCCKQSHWVDFLKARNLRAREEIAVRASVVARWWRTCLQVQETQVRSLVWEDSIPHAPEQLISCTTTGEPVLLSLGATTIELTCRTTEAHTL